MIKAYHNEMLEDEDGTRPFGVEIYNEYNDEIDFEFYATQEECDSRVCEILELETDDWSKI